MNINIKNFFILTFLIIYTAILAIIIWYGIDFQEKLIISNQKLYLLEESYIKHINTLQLKNQELQFQNELLQSQLNEQSYDVLLGVFGVCVLVVAIFYLQPVLLTSLHSQFLERATQTAPIKDIPFEYCYGTKVIVEHTDRMGVYTIKFMNDFWGNSNWYDIGLLFKNPKVIELINQFTLNPPPEA